jgi:hypothetical protein
MRPQMLNSPTNCSRSTVDRSLAQVDREIAAVRGALQLAEAFRAAGASVTINQTVNILATLEFVAVAERLAGTCQKISLCARRSS